MEHSEKKLKVCGVCEQAEGKYRCPQCSLSYCSVACSKAHRTTHPDLPTPEPKIVKARTAVEPAPLPGTVAGQHRQHPFDVLSQSSELQQLFLRYPELRGLLQTIATASLPPDPDQDVGDDTENHPPLRRGGRPFKRRAQAPWTPERGALEGVKALRVARDAYGRAGQAIREYEALVMKFVNGGGVDATAVFQRELAEENARVISQMLVTDDR